MYYIGKLFQAAGLTIIFIGFLQRFPDLMSYNTLILGGTFFLVGWILNRVLLGK